MADELRPSVHLSLADLRESYMRAALDESSVASDPLVQFHAWFLEARESALREPNAMTLATCTPGGTPSARIVLLKEFGEEGFTFYTNYLSRKAQELDANPEVALVFYWSELERQVRVEGIARRTSLEQSEQYFRLRPKGSRLGALASPQSRVIESRTILEKRLQYLETQYSGTDDIPVPDSWGGYCVSPRTIEFWQGRPNRLHDRLRFRRDSGGTWLLERLAP
jgi:pyridoxamine 5'-phosphate oxidase